MVGLGAMAHLPKSSPEGGHDQDDTAVACDEVGNPCGKGDPGGKDGHEDGSVLARRAVGSSRSSTQSVVNMAFIGAMMKGSTVQCWG